MLRCTFSLQRWRAQRYDVETRQEIRRVNSETQNLSTVLMSDVLRLCALSLSLVAWSRGALGSRV